MKWLFSTLLIANLGLLIWLLPQQNGASAGGQVQDIGQLQLVGETAEAVSPPPDASAAERLTESPSAGQAEDASSPELAALEPPPESPPPPPTPTCGSVGEFDKRSQAELLSVRMLAKGARTEISSETSNKQAGFWVLIPPQENRQGAIDIAQQLEAAGINDLWRFTSGNLAHAISLGLFTDEDRARARRDVIAKLGFNPEVRPRYREQTRYWLDYRYTGESPLSDAQWREISQEYPELEREERSCDD